MTLGQWHSRQSLEKLVLTHQLHGPRHDRPPPVRLPPQPLSGHRSGHCFTPHPALLDSRRTMFLDYSSAFNTIRPGRLTENLTDLGVPTPTCSWILDYLTERPQVVRMGRRVSAELAVSTGSPQGCCLSPKLFTLTHTTVSPLGMGMIN